MDQRSERQRLHDSIVASKAAGEMVPDLVEITLLLGRRVIFAVVRAKGRELCEDAYGRYQLEVCKRWMDLDETKNPTSYLRRTAATSLLMAERTEDRKSARAVIRRLAPRRPRR